MNNPSTTQSKLVTYFLILLGFAAGYLYQSKIGGAQANIAPLPEESKEDDWKSLEKLNVDFNLLQDSTYKNLKVFGELPVNPGNRGKDDPFQL